MDRDEGIVSRGKVSCFATRVYCLVTDESSVRWEQSMSHRWEMWGTASDSV